MRAAAAPAPESLLADLAAEGEDLDRLVAPLGGAGWATPTPAEGWSVRDSIVHLHRSDGAALAALRGEDLAAYVDGVLAPSYAGSDAALLADWRAGRTSLLAALEALPAGTRIPWFGPPMGAASFVTARLMETWAHGQDVADALAVRRLPTARLRHVADLGVRTRGWSYALAQREIPAVEVAVALTAPDGATWTWGPPGAADRVTGSALSFCLLVTQRRHRDDLPNLVAQGDAAAEWLSLAQAYAGSPGARRPPGAPPR